MAEDKFGWKQKFERLQAMKNDLPKRIANTAQLHFNSEFNKSEWDGKPWPERKDKKNTRHLLVKSGRLRIALANCIRIATWGHIQLAVDPPYAEAQNYGVHKAVEVSPHNRRQMGKQKVYSIETRRAHRVNAQVGEIHVKGFVRKMNLPARKFIGDSQPLRDKIHKLFNQACKQVFNV